MKKVFDFIVFDCDGVILNSNPMKTEAFRFALADEPASEVERFIAWHRDNGGISRQDKFRYFIEHLSSRLSVDALETLLQRFSCYCTQQLPSVPCIPGVEAYIRRSARAGSRLYVVSGGSESELQQVFAQRELAPHFEFIRGNPDSKLDIMRQLHSGGCFQGDGVYYGDARLDYELATQFAMEFVFVSGASDWHEGLELMRARNGRIIEDFNSEH